MNSQVLHTVWCNIPVEAAGEIWHWSPLWVKGIIQAFTPEVTLSWPSPGVIIATSKVLKSKHDGNVRHPRFLFVGGMSRRAQISGDRGSFCVAPIFSYSKQNAARSSHVLSADFPPHKTLANDLTIKSNLSSRYDRPSYPRNFSGVFFVAGL